MKKEVNKPKLECNIQCMCVKAQDRAGSGARDWLGRGSARFAKVSYYSASP